MSPGACLLVPVHQRHSSGHARAVGAWREGGEREEGREERGRKERGEGKEGERREGGEGGREGGEVKYMDKQEWQNKTVLTN